MRSRAIVYMYRNWDAWRFTGYDDLRLPVVLSIASFRSFDKTTPVYVLDQSDVPVYWDVFPQKLQFNVIHQPAMLRRIADSIIKWHDCHLQWQLLSKPFDAQNFAASSAEDLFVISDSDIFYLKDLWPLENDPSSHFCCGTNGGFYYFDKTSPITEKVFEIWKGMCLSSCLDPHTQSKTIDKYYKALHEESVWCWMLEKFSEHFPLKQISHRENFVWSLYRDAPANTYNLDEIKVLHLCNSAVGTKNRGAGVWFIKEIRDSICNVLSVQDIDKIFHGFDCDPYTFAETNDRTKLDKIREVLENDERLSTTRRKWYDVKFI